MIKLSEDIVFRQFNEFVRIATFVLRAQLTAKHFDPLWQVVN